MQLKKTIGFSAAIFSLFFAYYYQTSAYLPLGAGPDYRSHNDAAQFIYRHWRLATIPRDESELHFTVYGGTRTLRPPLSYIVAAAAAKVFPVPERGLHVAFRRGSALLCAGAVTAVFYALSVYFGSYWIGVLGALLLGLMPQFTFIASYNNDDSGAIFAAALMLAALVRLFRRGLSLGNALFFGAAAGLTVLAKPTAWLLALPVALFLVFFVRGRPAVLARYAAVAAVVWVAVGGWWLLFNMYHYGMDDPFLAKIGREVSARHSRFPPDHKFGYQAQNVGYRELLLDNYDNFWGKTWKSTIGNLDWLRLRLGPLQYGVYTAILFIGLLYVLLRVGRLAVTRFGAGDGRTVGFELLLFGALLFQFYVYTWTNIHNDIQLQGKYLIPVVPAVLILFFSAAQRLGAAAMRTWAPGGRAVVVPAGRLRAAAFFGAAALIVLVHVEAWIDYVIPFYRPPVYRFAFRGMEPLVLPRDAVKRTHDMASLKMNDGAIEIESSGEDPWFVVGLRERRLCRRFEGNILLEFVLEAAAPDMFQIFVDLGEGFRESDSYRRSYSAGVNRLLFAIGIPRCTRLRIDPMRAPGRVTIRRLAVGQLGIARRED